MKFLMRDRYLDKLRALNDTPDIKVITGIRRCGKSVLLEEYAEYLEHSFLFYEAKRYDLKGKKYLKSNPKYYLCDTAFRYAINCTRNADFGRMYENIVYIELLQ